VSQNAAPIALGGGSRIIGMSKPRVSASHRNSTSAANSAGVSTTAARPSSWARPDNAKNPPIAQTVVSSRASVAALPTRARAAIPASVASAPTIACRRIETVIIAMP